MDFTQTTTHIGLCAGYGGIELGLKRVIPNLRSVALCEIEAFACANLVAKMEAGLMDAAPIWTDLKTFPWRGFRDRVDILSGGYPCQPFSAAGKRLGTEDPRHLWPYIAGGIRILRPRLCFFENVEGHISLGLSSVISDLEEMGYTVSWGIFSATEVGAPHQRKRVFILAYDQRQRVEELGWQIAVASQQHSAWDDGGNAWPSRPGEPQHDWEPPRVVADSHRPHAGHGEQRPERTARDLSGRCCEGRGTEGMAHAHGGRGEEPEHQQANLPTEPSGCNGEAVGDTTSERPRTLGAEPTGQQRQAGIASTGDAVGNAHSPRPQERSGERGAGIQGTDANGGADADGEAEPSLGGNPDGSARGMDYAELCVTCDNRTDELRLLGNGVVPATAEKAFRVLLEKLQHNNERKQRKEASETI